MINKFVLTRSQNVNFVKDNMEDFINNNLVLSRYQDDDPSRQIAYRNFVEAYEFILNNKEVENDYKCLQHLHKILLKDLNDEVKSELNDQQIAELTKMINQPAKANLEIAIDVMLFILDKRLFTDGDVRVALTFANKIMIDCGCGFITVTPNNCDTFRSKLELFKTNQENDFKDWIYKYCIKGIKTEY